MNTSTVTGSVGVEIFGIWDSTALPICSSHQSRHTNDNFFSANHFVGLPDLIEFHHVKHLESDSIYKRSPAFVKVTIKPIPDRNTFLLDAIVDLVHRLSFYGVTPEPIGLSADGNSAYDLNIDVYPTGSNYRACALCLRFIIMV